MNPLLDQLKDIDGLDAIGLWPLSQASWNLIGFSLVLLGVILWIGMRRFTFKRSWKSDTLKKLSSLEKQLNQENAQETARLLSEYLKRIAIRKYTRSECASLSGDAWLQWLQAHDPKQYNWEKEASFLRDIAYAPPSSVIEEKQLRNAIQATKQWVY